MSRALLVLTIVTACTRADRRAAPPPPAVPPALAHATQTDLGHELDDANRLATWSEVRHRWQGQHLTWKVTRQRALCRTADACNVAAFPIQRPAAHGWMPQLAFAPGEFAKLEAACGQREQCEVTIDGTLADLDATGERATTLRFDGVRVAVR